MWIFLYRTRTAALAPVFLAAFVVAGGPAASGEARFTSHIAVEYRVSISGLEVGRVKLDYVIGADRYSVTGTGGTSSIVKAFFRVDASSQAKGRITRKGPQPAAFSLSYRIKKKRGGISMKFNGNAVRSFSVTPAKKPKSNHVPLKAAHKKNVLDPMSAFLTIATTARARADRTACNSTLPVFDGKMRYDIVLSYKGRRQIASKRPGGYQGPVAVCKAKYHPRAGHNPNGKNTKRIMANEGIEVWLIPVPNSRFFVPFMVRYPSKIGPVVISAGKYRLAQNPVAKSKLARH